MNKKIDISIAMTTYNGERFLQEQLDSFLWQTRLPDELVVCDDGSTDRTLEILKTFAQKAPFPVRIYRNPQRLGYTKNFEKCALMCSGDLIAFSDQDDIWLPEKLQLVEEAFETNTGIGICIHDNYVFNNDDNKIISYFWKNIYKIYPDFYYNHHFFLRDLSFQGNSLIIKREIIEKVLPVPSWWTYDQWIPFFSLFYCKSYFINKPLLKYRVHSHQTSYRAKKSDYSNLKNHLFCADKETIYILRYKKWVTAYKCLKKEIKENYNQDIINKITLIENMIKSSTKKKIYNIINYYLKGYYHRYEHGTRSMLRDLVLTFSMNWKRTRFGFGTGRPPSRWTGTT